MHIKHSAPTVGLEEPPLLYLYPLFPYITSPSYSLCLCVCYFAYAAMHMSLSLSATQMREILYCTVLYCNADERKREEGLITREKKGRESDKCNPTHIYTHML
jgi:hypothetical protein